MMEKKDHGSFGLTNLKKTRTVRIKANIEKEGKGKYGYNRGSLHFAVFYYFNRV